MNQDKTPSTPQPCRSAISREKVSSALAAFVGACGAVAAAAVVVVASNTSTLRGQGVELRGDVMPARITTTTSAPASKQATQPTTEPVATQGVMPVSRIEAPKESK